MEETELKEETDLAVLEKAVKERFETLCSLRNCMAEMVSRLSNSPIKAEDDNNAKREMGANRIKELTLQMDDDFFMVTTEIGNMLTTLKKII